LKVVSPPAAPPLSGGFELVGGAELVGGGGVGGVEYAAAPEACPTKDGLTMFRADSEMSAAAERADKAIAERDTLCLRLTQAPRRRWLNNR